jgi:hypothetical protein
MAQASAGPTGQYRNRPREIRQYGLRPGSLVAVRRVRLGHQRITVAFAVCRHEDALAVPIAPAGALPCRGSAANGTPEIIRDDVAALTGSELEHLGTMAWIGLCDVRHFQHVRVGL